jgi:AcrR family transcriptional regulator
MGSAMAVTSSGRRRRISKEARRAKLIAAAEAVFGEVGYADATMEVIAARGGVTRSLLYEHFTSLDDMYIECVRSARAELDARLLAASVSNQGHPEQQLRAGITAYFQFVSEHAAGWEVLAGTAARPAGPIADLVAELRFRSADQIAALFMQVAPDVDPAEARAGAHIVSGGGEQLARWWRLNPEVPIETIVDNMMTVVWRGLRDRLGDVTA